MKKLLLFILFPILLFSQETNSLQKKIAGLNSGDQVHIWVFFKDKGLEVNKFLSKPSSVVSEKSLKRRSKVLSQDKLIDFTDLPVYTGYITQLENKGFIVKQKSRWFNAVSGYMKKEDIQAIESLPFIKTLDVVQHFKDDNLKNFQSNINLSKTNSNTGTLTQDYGLSLMQNNLLNTVPMHDLGFTGQGLTICLMDAGFTRYRTHSAFQSMHVIATWDFVNNNWGVDDSTDMGEGSHGTMTLSAIGGYKPGILIGTAYGADYLLAKTENTDSETPVEEDNWVAALEWADSIGVDVTSTSLGYLDFDPPYTSLTWEDMNGNTAKITIAGDLAVKKGILVLNSAGNNGDNPSHNTLGAPADGDSIISVGAVDSLKNRIWFSSVGPTVDGRIKPDIMSLGLGGIAASSNSDNSFGGGSGTSFACPLAAGAAALILCAHPTWTPMMIREALRMTADHHTNPDNHYGWGVIDVTAANNYFPSGVSGDKINNPSYDILQNYPNPFNPSTTISFTMERKDNASLIIYNSIGQVVQTLFSGEKEPGKYSITWNAGKLSSGVYFCEFTTPSFRKSIKLLYLK